MVLPGSAWAARVAFTGRLMSAPRYRLRLITVAGLLGVTWACRRQRVH